MIAPPCKGSRADRAPPLGGMPWVRRTTALWPPDTNAPDTNAPDTDAPDTDALKTLRSRSYVGSRYAVAARRKHLNLIQVRPEPIDAVQFVLGWPTRPVD